MNLGNLIRQKRKEKGLTQSELAEKIGVSTNSISKYERNIISNMGKSKVLALSKILDIPTVYFIEAADSNEDKEEITSKEFAAEVTALLDKTSNISEQQKALLIHALNLICSDE